MKNIYFKLMLFILTTLPFASQAQAFAKGQKDLDIGLGAGNSFIHATNYSHFPALGISLDYGITDDISVGGYIGYSRATLQYSGTDYCSTGNGNWVAYTDSYTWTFLIIGARADYHFGKLLKTPDNLDVYAGLLLGDDFASYTYSSNVPCHTQAFYGSNTYGGVTFSGHIGTRYRFNDHAGIFGELGWGISYLTIGFNYKF